jgi:carbon-monoxide dehydrogenase large subunit
MGYIGKPMPQYDSFLKVTGTATYAFDVELPGMLHAKLVTSPHAHAKIVKVDTSKAEKVPGVVAVATGREFPYRLGIYVGDRDVLAIDKVRWVGHPVAAVIAETLEAAEQGIDQVEVEYEPLPTVFDPMEALKPGAPIVHEKMAEYRVSTAFKPIPGTNIANQFKLVRGDVEKGLKESDVTIQGEFYIPHISHAFMETQCLVAHYKKDGTIEIWTSTQSPFSTRYLMALSLGIPIVRRRIRRKSRNRLGTTRLSTIKESRLQTSQTRSFEKRAILLVSSQRRIPCYSESWVQERWKDECVQSTFRYGCGRLR